MRQLVRFVAVLLFGVLVLGTPVAYAVPENASPSNSELTEQGSVPEANLGSIQAPGAVVITQIPFPDGGKRTKYEIKPSIEGAMKGAAAGAAVGTTVCASTGVAAPIAPGCAALGGVVGGVTGFVYGPAD